MKKSTFLFCILFLLSGCVTRYPMGLSQEQWEALSPAKQAEYQAQQFALDEQRRQQLAAEREARAREQRAIELAEQERLQRLYTQGRFGDVVRVTVQGGLMQIHSDLYTYHPVAFEIAKGEVKSIPFTRTGRIQQQISIRVRLANDGNTLFFHDDSRHMFSMVNMHWENGQTYRLPRQGKHASHTISDAIVTIKTKNMTGAPERVIIEHR